MLHNNNINNIDTHKSLSRRTKYLTYFIRTEYNIDLNHIFSDCLSSCTSLLAMFNAIQGEILPSYPKVMQQYWVWQLCLVLLCQHFIQACWHFQEWTPGKPVTAWLKHLISIPGLQHYLNLFMWNEIFHQDLDLQPAKTN